MRLEGWILREAVLRTAPQDEVNHFAPESFRPKQKYLTLSTRLLPSFETRKPLSPPWRRNGDAAAPQDEVNRPKQKYLTLRSIAQRCVSKGGSFERRSFGPLLRMR